MNGTARRFGVGAGLAGLVTLGWVLTVQAAKPAQHGIPLPMDWTHRHMIFSQPGTAQQRAQVESDPRYWQQMYRRSQRLVLPASTREASALEQFDFRLAANAPKNPRLRRDWAESMGTGATVGAGNFPAKFSFDSTSANCDSATQPDFVVFSTSLPGSGTQASIGAFDNLYTGCGGSVPMPYWAYNTSGATPGPILTSPVFSRDGKQVAFVQTDGVTTGTLVLLKWAATRDTFGGPGTPTLKTPGAYPGCIAPCMTTIDLRDGSGVVTDDRTSSVFYDYNGDIAWVSDSRGWLHKFNPVFKGMPAEVRAAPWPVQVNPGNPNPASSPVFDRISKNIFLGDLGGFFYRVDATTGTVVTTAEIDFGAGLVAGPIVDATKGLVYISASSDGSAACAGGADCAGFFQFPTNFTSGSFGTEAVVGVSTVFGVSTPQPMYDGFFDNTYITSANATGNFYVCGNTGANPTLYLVPVLAGALGTPAIVSTLATATSNSACSPVTDVFVPGATIGSAATERVFVSVQGNSTAAACSGSGGGCIQNLIDTPWQASTAFTVGQEILVKSSSPLVRFINVVITAGTTGTTQPSWPSTSGVTRTDGGVVWLNQGNTTTPINAWAANHAYNFVGGRILDSNGNVEVVKVKGTSGGTAPSWPTTPGATRTDNTVTWINAGAFPSFALPAAGGTSAIIIDNTVSPGTLAGASQVYFSTQADQLCATSGTTGGCAVQASQPTLQ
jgi:hypothetical protein